MVLVGCILSRFDRHPHFEHAEGVDPQGRDSARVTVRAPYDPDIKTDRTTEIEHATRVLGGFVERKADMSTTPAGAPCTAVRTTGVNSTGTSVHGTVAPDEQVSSAKIVVPVV